MVDKRVDAGWRGLLIALACMLLLTSGLALCAWPVPQRESGNLLIGAGLLAGLGYHQYARRANARTSRLFCYASGAVVGRLDDVVAHDWGDFATTEPLETFMSDSGTTYSSPVLQLRHRKTVVHEVYSTGSQQAIRQLLER